MKKVFISYSHKDEEWKNRLQPYLRTLEHEGQIVVWDDRKIGTGEDWYPAIKRELDQAAVGICLISADYLASDFIRKEEIPALRERRRQGGMLVLPVLVRPCPWKTVQWLKGIQMFPRDGRSLAEIRGQANRERALSEIVEYVYEKINDSQFQLSAPVPKWPPPDKVDIGRLPQTGMELFGRQKELDLLDEAWDSGRINMVSFVGYAGVGKSTLLNKWLERMAGENYRGARLVYGWSFYSYGTSERVISADKFIVEALTWFGDVEMASSKALPWDKGRRLAELVRRQRTLLILDGLEPLQSAFGFERGKIKDPALSILVSQLARSNNGLCVISTRENVAELAGFDERISQRNLEKISMEAGRALLRVSGVQGGDEELETASEAFGNHALAVNLLGSYLHGIAGHHVRDASKIADLDIAEEEGRHPWRVIAAFEKRFGEGPEVQLLNILGLFDRPAEITVIKAMCAGPAITGLTDYLRGLYDSQWQALLEKLRGLRLLARKSMHSPDILDCHPLVREYFGEKLKDNNPEAWLAAHERLYEYYRNLPKKESFDTLEEMEPLFMAVLHGCLAGHHQQVFDKVFVRRIHRGGHHDIIRRFGAVGTDLAVLGCFFETRWQKLVSGLRPRSKTRILDQTGYDLLALGRLSEAAEFYEAALKTAIEEGELRLAGVLAGHLSRVHFLLGNLRLSRRYGEAGVVYILDTKDKYNQVINLLTLADTLHRSGEPDEAEIRFKEADQIEQTIKYDPRSHWVPRGIRYNWFLQETGQYQVVLERTERALKILHQLRGPKAVRIAGERMCRGMARMLKNISKRKTSFVKATDDLEFAVSGMRRVGRQDDIATSLLARAELHRVRRKFPKAERDLNEAFEIVTRCGMRLFEANCYIEYARLYLSGKDKENAGVHYKKARALVDDMGYHQREPELLLIQAELEIVEGDKEAAEKTLKKAKDLIDKMGCHRWDVEVKRLKKSI